MGEDNDASANLSRCSVEHVMAKFKHDSIELDQCVHGGLYRIFSRNLSLGVFNEGSKGFIGVREKFGDRYLFTEYHFDTGAPHGTVFPKELLEMIPDSMEISERNEALKRWLEEKLDEHAAKLV